MITIKRTRSRNVVPLLLKSETETAGPYYLVDRAGYGVSWRKSKRISRSIGSNEWWTGRPQTQSITWIPVFNRARLAFDLVDMFDEMTPQEAKFISDKAWQRWGDDASPVDVEKYVLYNLRT